LIILLGKEDQLLTTMARDSQDPRTWRLAKKCCAYRPIIDRTLSYRSASASQSRSRWNDLEPVEGWPNQSQL